MLIPLSHASKSLSLSVEVCLQSQNYTSAMELVAQSMVELRGWLAIDNRLDNSYRATYIDEQIDTTAGLPVNCSYSLAISISSQQQETLNGVMRIPPQKRYQLGESTQKGTNEVRLLLEERVVGGNREARAREISATWVSQDYILALRLRDSELQHNGWLQM